MIELDAVLPELVMPRGGSTRALRRRAVLGLRAPMLELLAAAPVPAAHADLARSLARSIGALPDEAFADTFDHPFAWSQLAPPSKEDPHAASAGALRVVLDADAPARAVGLARFLVGSPAIPELRIELPLAGGSMFLPHLHATVRGNSLEVAQDGAAVVLRLDRAQVLTLPRSPLFGLRTDRLDVPPLLAGWRAYNGVAEIGARLEVMLSHGLARADLDEGRAIAAGWTPPPHHVATLGAGRTFLEEVWPEAAGALPETFHGVVCLPHAEDGHFFSLTTGKLRNVLIAGMVAPVQVGDSLVHEGAHTRLWPLFDFDPLLDDDGAAIHRSPWRRDLRPLKGILNGVHAFTNVVAYYRRILERRPDEAEVATEKLALHWPRVEEAWALLVRDARTTPLGARFLALQGQAIADEARALAALGRPRRATAR